MGTQYGFGIAALATITTALALNGCEQRSDQALSTNPNNPSHAMSSPVPSSVNPSTTSSTAPSADTSNPTSGVAANSATTTVAATGQKVEAVVDDAAITTKVKAALIADPGLQSLQIGVDTKNGAVTLSGSVDSMSTKDHAKQVAASVSGVVDVIDNMIVKNTG